MRASDVMIIGAGPAGLTSALYLGRANRNVLLLEKDAPGGKLLTIPKMNNYPGTPFHNGLELAKSFVEGASHFGVNAQYGAVNLVTKEGNVFHVSTEEETFEAKAVIIATGLTNVPSIEGEKEFLHKGVSYCATCDGRFFKGRPMAVIGDHEKAYAEAVYLSSLSNEVYLFISHELPKDSAYAASLLQNPNVKMIVGASMKRIEGDNKVKALVYSLEGKEMTLPVSAVFPLLGEKAASRFLSSLPVKMNHDFIVTDEEMNSNIPGLFAIGDIRDKKLRQVVTAASDGAIASASVISYLNHYGK